MSQFAHTRSQFLSLLTDLVYRATSTIDDREREVRVKEREVAIKATLKDPDYKALIKQLSALVGEANVPTYARLGLETGWRRYDAAYDNLGGELGAILQRNGYRKFGPFRSSYDELGEEALLLSGALTTTKKKYWDEWFAPTEVFIKALRRDDVTIESVKQAIRDFIEALK